MSYVQPAEQVSSSDGAEAELRRAILSRTTRVSHPTVVMMPEPPHESIRRLLPGTIVFFVAPRGSSLFARARQAALAYDYETLDLLWDRIGFDFIRIFMPQQRQDDPTARGLSGVPSFAEFRYKHKLLVRGLFPISTWEVAEAAILWTGGALVDAEFTCIEYVTSPEAPELETLVVKVPPRLTTLERAVIDQVSRDQSEMHLRGSTALFTQALVRIVGEAVDFLVDIFRPRIITGEPPSPSLYLVRYGGCYPYTLMGGAVLPTSVSETLRRLGEEARLDPARLGGSVDSLLDLREELIAGRVLDD